MSTVEKWLLVLCMTNTFAIIVISIAMRQVGVRLRELVGKLAETRKSELARLRLWMTR